VTHVPECAVALRFDPAADMLQLSVADESRLRRVIAEEDEVCPTPSNEDSVRSKIVTADEAIVLIRDGDTLSSTGFVQIGFAEALLSALERRFLTTGTPRNLALFAGHGDGKDLGLNHLGHEGLLRRVVAGGWQSRAGQQDRNAAIIRPDPDFKHDVDRLIEGIANCM